MKRPNPNFGRSGLNLVEVLVVIAVIGILAVVFIPRVGPSRKAKVPICMSNLKQIDIGFLLFANDSAGRFPMQISVTNGGSMEFVYSGHTFPHLEKLKKYRSEPRTFICPFETTRQVAASYEALNDLNLSYFVNADASTNDPSHAILAGDRFLQVNRQSVAPGLLSVTTNLNLSWTPNFHASRGCFAFADGHVDYSQDHDLVSIIASQPLATNRFSIP
jgi:prepilin-type N-terminal cleavage/methylation domain-containing protein/prepilin-type processing-associated H-X9-DG protein